MKIIKKDYSKGLVKVEINTLDDLWVLYNIIEAGDLVSGKTQRKIEYASEKEKKTIFLKIEVEKVEFHKTSNVLRISGKIVEGPEDVPLGSYHTISVEPGYKLTIEKKEFKKYQIDKLEEAVKSTSKPRVLLTVFEPGHADFALLRGWGLDYIGTLDELIEGKELADQMEKSKDYFYKQYLKSIKNLVESHNLDKVIVGSISLYQEEFRKYVENSELKDKVIFTNVSTIGKTGLNEILKRGVLSNIIKEERITKETQLVEKLMAEIGKEGLATYGIKETEEAVNYGAVDTLLITDTLITKYRSENKFDKLEKIMKMVESQRGKVEIISSQHDAGKMLDNLGGMAALLRFKV